MLELSKGFTRPIVPAITLSGQNGRKIIAAAEDVRFSITDNEIALKYQEAALNESIDSLYEQAAKETEDHNSESEELGPTREHKVGDKTKVYWPLNDQ